MMTVLMKATGKGMVSAAAVAVLAAALAGCGGQDSWAQVQKARAQFEVEISGSIPDTQGGNLLIEAVLKKNGRAPLETLTLRVDQRNARGGVMSVEHVSIDVSDFRKWESRQISLRVPLAGEAAHGLAMTVETEPQPGVTYPEFEGLSRPE